MSQLNPLHASPSHFLKINFIITLPSMPRSSKWSISLRSPPPKKPTLLRNLQMKTNLDKCTTSVRHTKYNVNSNNYKHSFMKHRICFGCSCIMGQTIRYLLYLEQQFSTKATIRFNSSRGTYEDGPYTMYSIKYVLKFLYIQRRLCNNKNYIVVDIY